MTIKNKLLGLIGIPSIGIIVASLFTVITYLPYERMQSEQKVLFNLEAQVVSFQKEIVGLNYKTIAGSNDEFEMTKAMVAQRFEEVDTLDTLYHASERIALSLDTVKDLRESFESEWESFIAKYQIVAEDLYGMEGVSGESTVQELYAAGFQKLDEAPWRILVADLNTLGFQVVSLDRSLDALVQVMQAEFSTIDEQLAIVRSRMIGITSMIFLAVLVVSIIMALLLARGIIANINHIFTRVEELGKGDLTIMVKVNSHDELQELGNNVNRFILGLNKAICDIKSVSQDTVSVKNSLVATVGGAEAAAGNIQSSAGTISGEVKKLDERITRSTDSVRSVATHSAEVLEMLQDHTAMVEESTAAITEMISSIANVSDNAEKRYESTGQLVETIKRGSDQLQSTAELIHAVTESVDNIRQTAQLIQNVAAQTSLLAMNAAIEAAHAGDRGAGFAVVADEIRILSEETSRGSKHISGFLKTVIARIEEAAAAGDETQAVFREVDTVVADVGNSLSEITASMRELNIGGQQILEASSSLQDFSVNLKDKGLQMEQASGELNETMDFTRETSSGVQTLVSQISGEIDQINDSMRAVARLSENLDQMTTNVDRSLEQFSTEVVQTEACLDIDELSGV